MTEIIDEEAAMSSGIGVAAILGSAAPLICAPPAVMKISPCLRGCYDQHAMHCEFFAHDQ
jgi:hypothetical protein